MPPPPPLSESVGPPPSPFALAKAPIFESPTSGGISRNPIAELPSAPDPPIDEGECGAEPGPAKVRVVGITDEWGEKADPEVEASSPPDPPKDDDEWGAEAGFLSGNGSLVPEDDKLGDLKRCLVDSFYGKELGLRATLEDRAEILELVNQLEAANPIKALTEAPDLLDGNWILLYTAFSELLPLLAVGATPFLKVKRISQVIDSKTLEVVNATTLSSPFATFSFSATASFEVQTSSRIQVQFKEGIFQPPELSSSLDIEPHTRGCCKHNSFYLWPATSQSSTAWKPSCIMASDNIPRSRFSNLKRRWGFVYPRKRGKPFVGSAIIKHQAHNQLSPSGLVHAAKSTSY